MAIKDHLNSEDQMEIMMMMMVHQTAETQAIFGAYNEITEFSPSDYACPSLYNNPSAIFSSSSFTNTSPSLSEETQTPFLSRWDGEFSSSDSERPTSMATMREMIFRLAAMQPIHIDPESVKPPKRKNVEISKDPQSVAARHRRGKISERIRILQRLVPGGMKMDTASMLDETIHYVKFLEGQVESMERAAANRPTGLEYVPIVVSNGGSYFPVGKDWEFPPRS